MNNIRTYLRNSAVVCQLDSSDSVQSNTIRDRAMISVRDTAVAALDVSPVFEQCSCSVPLVRSNTVLFPYDQVADILPTQASGVVVTLTGNPPQNTNS